MTGKPHHDVELADGRRVRFIIKTRPGDPYYFVFFTAPDGRRLERSTRQPNQKRAELEAAKIIREVFAPRQQPASLTWDEAKPVLVRAMKARNLRRRSIEDYLLMLDTLKSHLPDARGPGDVTVVAAKGFKAKRMEQGIAASTVFGNVNKLSVIWSKWLIKECDLLTENPWEEVEKPKLDEPEPRYLEPEEEKAFLAWLEKRWEGWQLPILFFRLKSSVGRRILQLCSLPSTALKDGRVIFHGELAKGRRMEYARIPADLFQQLQALAGPTLLFERYSADLNAIYRRRGQRRYARCGEFKPERLKRFLQNEVSAFCKAHEGEPGFRAFTAHNFRDTAMTRAWDCDIDLDKAAIAFGCNRETMKKHYIRKDNLAVADAVFEKVNGTLAMSKQGADGDGEHHAGQEPE